MMGTAMQWCFFCTGENNFNKYIDKKIPFVYNFKHKNLFFIFEGGFLYGFAGV